MYACYSFTCMKLYLISSCDSTVIAFKQHVLVCYQKSSENGIVSCKNCHNFITERF